MFEKAYQTSNNHKTHFNTHIRHTLRLNQTFPLCNGPAFNIRASAAHGFKHGVPALAAVVAQHRLVDHQGPVGVVRRHEAVRDPVQLAAHPALLLLRAQEPFGGLAVFRVLESKMK